VQDIQDYDPDKLYKLCKVWGFVKYHTPDSIDFDQGLFDLLQYAVKSTDRHTFDDQLYQWVKSINKHNKIADTKPVYDSCLYRISFEWIRDTSLFDTKFIEELAITEKTIIDTGHYVYIPIINPPFFINEKQYESATLPNDKLTLLTLFRYWNIIEYFYPYHYIIPDWDRVLKDFIPRFLSIDSRLDLMLTLKLLIAHIKDGHGLIGSIEDNKLWQKYFGDRVVPVYLENIKGKCIVVALDSAGGEITLRKGDEILKLHDTPVDTLVKSLLPYMPGVNMEIRINLAFYHVLKTFNQNTSVTYCRGQDTVTVSVQTRLWDSINYNIYSEKKISSSPSYRFLQDDTGYLFIGNLSEFRMPYVMAKFRNTKAIIVDARFYPKIRNWNFLKYFTHFRSGLPSFFIATQQRRFYPGCFVSGWNTPIVDTVSLYKGQVYVLVNHHTLSLGEVFVMALQMNPNTKVIGSQTMGAIGSISRIPLPFGVTAIFSGLSMYYADGTEVQNKGIKIDYEVYPDIKDLQEGRDTYIEKALKLINNK
jgi:hypothetical protein